MKVVVYHRNCTDGTCAMQVVRKAIGTEGVEYIAAQYNEKMPTLLTDANPNLRDVELIVVDFSFPRAELLRLRASCKSLLVLDHHVSAQADLEGIEGCHFDNERSGAMMAWNHFFPGQFPPLVVQYVQDRDLWRWTMEYCKEFCACAKHHMRDQSFWDRALNGFTPQELTSVLDEGKVLVEVAEEQIQKSVRSVVYTEIFGYRTTLVNVTQHISEVGNAICQQLDVPFSMTYFIAADGNAILSFRAKKGVFDVTSIAESLGGGGHASAAGAPVPLEFLAELYETSKRINKPVEVATDA